MEHEDGYCDGCGCELVDTWLTRDGEMLCRVCWERDIAGVRQRLFTPAAVDRG